MAPPVGVAGAGLAAGVGFAESGTNFGVWAESEFWVTLLPNARSGAPPGDALGEDGPPEGR